MMTQSQVAAYMAEKLGLTKKQGKTVLEELNALVVRELKKEGSLRLAGLGICRKRKTKTLIAGTRATGHGPALAVRCVPVSLSRPACTARWGCVPRARGQETRES